jgi:hypothetical protein
MQCTGRVCRVQCTVYPVYPVHQASWAQYSIVGLVYHVSGVQCIVLCAGGVNSVWGMQGMVGTP